MNKIRLLLAVGLVYGVAHVIYTYVADISWMPPPPPANPDPVAARKKNPDGPLILRDDLFLESPSKGSSSLMKVVMPDGGGVKMWDSSKMKKLTVSESFLRTFKKSAKAINKKSSQFVLFTLINKAFLNLTLNWLCNVYALQTPHEDIHKSVLIVSLDEISCVKINKEWKNVTCLTLKGVDTHYNQPLEMAKKLHLRLLNIRVNLIAALAEAKLPFVVFETDSIWLKNPMQRLFANSDLIEDADLVLPVNWHNERGQRFGFTPMVAFATNGTRRAAQEMRRIMNRKANAVDQAVLNTLCATQYMGLVCREFQWQLLADGKWLKMSESERKASKTAPYIVNNNNYVGVKNKIARQTINGLWFLSQKNVCNLSKARKMLAKYI